MFIKYPEKQLQILIIIDHTFIYDKLMSVNPGMNIILNRVSNVSIDVCKTNTGTGNITVFDMYTKKEQTIFILVYCINDTLLSY